MSHHTQPTRVPTPQDLYTILPLIFLTALGFLLERFTLILEPWQHPEMLRMSSLVSIFLNFVQVRFWCPCTCSLDLFCLGEGSWTRLSCHHPTRYQPFSCLGLTWSRRYFTNPYKKRITSKFTKWGMGTAGSWTCRNRWLWKSHHLFSHLPLLLLPNLCICW